MLPPWTRGLLELEDHGHVIVLALGNRWDGSSYPWFVVHLELGLTRFYRLFDTLITMAWGLSLVGAMGVVLGWVAFEGCPWRGSCYLALCYFLRGSVAHLRGSTSFEVDMSSLILNAFGVHILDFCLK
jgi:hypothetical protein